MCTHYYWYHHHHHCYHHHYHYYYCYCFIISIFIFYLYFCRYDYHCCFYVYPGWGHRPSQEEAQEQTAVLLASMAVQLDPAGRPGVLHLLCPLRAHLHFRLQPADHAVPCQLGRLCSGCAATQQTVLAGWLCTCQVAVIFHASYCQLGSGWFCTCQLLSLVMHLISSLVLHLCGCWGSMLLAAWSGINE